MAGGFGFWRTVDTTGVGGSGITVKVGAADSAGNRTLSAGITTKTLVPTTPTITLTGCAVGDVIAVSASGIMDHGGTSGEVVIDACTMIGGALRAAFSPGTNIGGIAYAASGHIVPLAGTAYCTLTAADIHTTDQVTIGLCYINTGSASILYASGNYLLRLVAENLGAGS
jgi:hypothetical protein